MPQEHDLNVTLAKAIPPGTAFTHEYDFGTTTELKGQVLTEYQAPASGRKIRVLARNTPPDIRCDECGEPAGWLGVVGEEDWEWRALCDACIEQKDYSRDMLLPVVNSPRTGVCGYTGEGATE